MANIGQSISVKWKKEDRRKWFKVTFLFFRKSIKYKLLNDLLEFLDDKEIDSCHCFCINLHSTNTW
jgi:hypothetical protein